MTEININKDILLDYNAMLSNIFLEKKKNKLNTNSTKIKQKNKELEYIEKHIKYIIK